MRCLRAVRKPKFESVTEIDVHILGVTAKMAGSTY